MRLKSWMLLILSVILFSATAPAQTGAASIRGIVKDPTGAIIPAAEVEALQIETGARNPTRANDSGRYVFPSLQPGRYKLTARHPGMQSWEGELLLQTGQAAELNIPLEVSTSSTQITVAGEVSSMLTTTNATLSTTIEHQRVEQLPLNGRSLVSLIQFTTPGAELGGGSGGVRVYGMREGSMEFVQDGATSANLRLGTGYARMPGLDTVDEFRIETNNASAKSNRPAKAIVKTKSGTNAFHGAVFETARNNAIGLARAREDYYEKPPTLIRNEFGLAGGGPLTLPKIYNGKNRTFIFLAYERFARRQYTTGSFALPTASMRQGDFSGLIDGQGRKYSLYDPWSSTKDWSRTPFPNNQIPISQRSSLAEYMYKIMPEPTLAGVNPLVSSNYFAPQPSNRDDHTGTMRIDHRLSSRDQIFVRYSQSTALQLFANGGGTSPVAIDRSTNIRVLETPNRTIAGSWSSLFSPTFFAETTASYAKETRANITGDQSKDYASLLGLPNPFDRLGFPEISNVGFGMNTTESNQSFLDSTAIWAVTENMTKVTGRHELEFGGSFRYSQADIRPQEQYVRGMHQFASLATSLYDKASGSRYAAVARTGHDSANFFLGVPSLSRLNKTRPWFHFQGPEYGFYFQDNFKVTPRLTLNLGLRAEAFPILAERDNMLTSFDPKSMAIVLGQPLDKLYGLGAVNAGVIKAYTDLGVRFTTPGEAGLPAKMFRTDTVNWLPRLGFAYRVNDGKHPIVLRGGYSRFSYPVPVGGYYARARSNAPLHISYSFNLNSSQQSPDGLSNYLLRNAPVYVAGKNMNNLFSPETPTLGGLGSVGASFYDTYQPVTKADQWNLTIEREILPNTVLRVAYLGNHGSDLDQLYDTNESIPNYVWFTETGLPIPQGADSGVARRVYTNLPYGNIEKHMKTGWSNFNGAQVELNRRFSRGIGFQFFYLMSNSFRAGGNDWRDDIMQDTRMFPAGSVPEDFDQRNRLLNYHLDAEIPKHHIRWNWLVDLPFGRGKKIGGNVGGIMDRLIGGWQVAGMGQVRSRWWQMPTRRYRIPEQHRVLRDQVPDRRLPQRPVPEGLPLLQRIHPGQPHQ